MRDEILPDTAKLIRRGRPGQGTRVMGTACRLKIGFFSLTPGEAMSLSLIPVYRFHRKRRQAHSDVLGTA